ncbi:MAG: FHA domain-containing protein, partial [Planctomycetota bacterium]|nr:FHA domain-containing protein [Planctomycetota bacterium]
MNILISVLNGRMKGRKFPVAEGKTVKIGRGSGADFVIVDAMSSRLHCEVTNNSTAFILRDLGSSNGTFKDDQAIKQVNVYSGDRFKIGSTVFEIRGIEGPIDNYMTNAEPVVRVEKSGITKTRIVLNPKRLEQEDEKKTVLRRVGPKQEKNDYTLGEFESLVSEIEGLDDEGEEEEEDLPPITVIASGREVRPSTGDDEFPPVEVVESGYAKDSENDLEDLPPIEVVSSGKALGRAERGPEPEFVAVDSDVEPEFEDSDLPVVTVESPGVSEPKSAKSDNEAALADPFATESAERPSISVPEPMDSLDPPVASEMSIHVKTTYPEYGQEIPDPKLDAEPMGSPDTVTEHDGLVMVEPGRTREATPAES